MSKTKAPKRSSFQVQKRMCKSCIYRPECALDIKKLEDQVREKVRGQSVDFFKGYRECHHAETGSGVCCRGFWERHKDQFQLGQVAQRLDLVEYVEIDIMKEEAACTKT